MSEHKTTQDALAEVQFQLTRLGNEMKELTKKMNSFSEKYIKLEEQEKSLLNYLNTDSDSINQDKTE